MDVPTKEAKPEVHNLAADQVNFGFHKSEIEGSIPERFEKMVDLYPERVAIKYGETSLSYNEFNKKSNQLARLILKHNELASEPVAFLLDIGIKPILAIFAIWKTGGFYIPLDPSFPQDRLDFILKDSGARFILTDDEHIAQAQELAKNGAELINLDDIDPELSAENLQIDISPDALTCLHYTSGSTGTPKGVIQNHRNLLHTAWCDHNQNRSTPDDRIALLHSIGFAASVVPILGTLLIGGTLYPFNLKNGLQNLATWLGQEKITVYRSVSTLFRHLALSLSADDKFPNLRLITLGGEAVLKSDIELYRKHFSQYSLLSHGIGGTEMQVFRSFLVDKNTEIHGNVVPVGYPTEDKEVLILDEDGRQLGYNEVGEIVVRSQYLSPGYWRNPDLTEKKFKIEMDNPTLRNYWTGDLGRLDSDGCLYHLGRKDFQVKIRGFRIELGEIESVLMQHPNVQDAAVLVHEQAESEKRLVAYVVYDSSQNAPTMEEMRIFIKKNLPDYMVPFMFIRMEAMPLTPTGKIDRLSLPGLADVFELDQDYVPPRDEVEMKLVSIWEQVLGLSPIGIKNDFFQLGGHSLLAATLITETEAAFDKNIDLAMLSEAATIEGMAEILRADGRSVVKTALVAIQPQGTRPILYCVHGVGGHVIPFMKLSEYLGADQPVYGLQVKSTDERQNGDYTIEVMAEEYLEELRSMQPGGPYYLAGFSFGGFVAYEMARQLSAQGQQVGLVGIFDTQAASAPGYLKSLSSEKKLIYRMKKIMNKVDYHSQNVSKLHLDEVVPYIRKKRERLSMQEAIMGDVEPEQVPDHLLEIIDANIAALRKYSPGEYDGKVIIFKSDNHGRGVYYGWEELARGGVEVHYVPGNHRGILQEPNVARLAELLRNCIDKKIIPEVH